MILKNGLIFFIFYSEFEKKIIFYYSLIRFCFMPNFLFSKNWFLKRIKVPIFSKKKKNSSYYGSFVINKNVFFFKA